MLPTGSHGTLQVRNADRREIVGRFPYGETITYRGQRERFAARSIRLPDVFELTDDHDPGPPVVVGDALGVAVSHVDNDDAAEVVFRVLRSRAGDELLARAAAAQDSGAPLGMSLGWPSDQVESVTDPDDGATVYTNVVADHAALTPRNAYPSARVLTVRGTTVENDETATAEDHGTATGQGSTPAPAVSEAPSPVTVADPAVTELRAELRAELAEVRRLAEVRVPAVPRSDVQLRALHTAGDWIYYNAIASGRMADATEFQVSDARDRVERSHNELRALTGMDLRASTTANLPGAVPDQFLGPIEELVRAGRPFLNALGSLPLPAAGMDIHRPKVTTGTAVAWEATEGDTPSETVMVTSDVTGAVKALKGKNALTLQASLRSSPSAIDALLRDMASAMGTELDNSAINGTGTVTTSTGALAGTLANGSIGDQTIATWTTAAFLAAYLAAIGDVWTACNQAPRFVVVHPRRAALVQQLVDSTGRPILDIDPVSSPVNAIGGGGSGVPGGIRGVAGVPWVIDSNIPTNLGTGTDEDIIMVVGPTAFEYYEDSRRLISLQSADNFQTTYGQAALAALLPIFPDRLVTVSGAGLAV